MASGTAGENLQPYVPRLALEWPAPGKDWCEVEGALAFVDISGFTALSERLARRGRIGSEELTDILSTVFGEMLRLAYDRGGMLIKFGGDALLILFTGPDYVAQGTAAVFEMQAALRRANERRTSAGRLHLRMSVGVHAGRFHAFQAGSIHRELLLGGPGASTTVLMEQTAEADEVVVSPEMAAALPAAYRVTEKGPGVILRRWRHSPQPPGPTAGIAQDAEAILRWIPVGLRRELLEGNVESEHRFATICFLRFDGIDDLMDQQGPGATAEALGAVIGIVQAAALAEGVTFLASDIDRNGVKAILTGGIPGTLEDDAGRALRAVRRVIDADPPLPVRIGVNYGHVFAGNVGTAFRHTYTVMGDTVNLAARLMAAAQPGTIYATTGVLGRSRTEFASVPLEPFRVKGKSEPVQAYRVEQEMGPREFHPAALPFAGREAEIAGLLTDVDGALNGRGRVVEIVGEAGIGKSRLLEEFTRRLPAGTSVISIRGEPYGAEAPYRALRDRLRRLLGVTSSDSEAMLAQLTTGLAALAPGLMPLAPLIGTAAHVDLPDTPVTADLEPRFRRERLALAVTELVCAVQPGPAVFIIDDSQWIDSASWAVIEQLGTAAAALPWLVVILRREAPPEIPHWIDRVLTLGPLDEQAVETLVNRATESTPMLPHEQRALIARSAGSPLFLEALLLGRAPGATSLPESLDDVITAEIDSLPPHVRRLLRHASVLGQSFGRATLGEVLGAEAADFESALALDLARYLVPDGEGRLRFRHGLLRDVAYEGLPFSTRRGLHERAGLAIERLAAGSPELFAGELALHFALAENHERSWRYGRTAGDRSRAAYANVEAALHYERAVAAARRLRSLPPAEVVAARVALAEAREEAGLFQSALAALDGAGRLSSDVVTRAALMRRKARVYERVGRNRVALQITSRAYCLVADETSAMARAERARLLAFTANIRQRQGQAQVALQMAERAATEATAADERLALARAYMTMHWAHTYLGNPKDAVFAPLALEIFEQERQQSMAATVRMNLGAEAYLAGRWDDALDCYRRAAESQRRAGNDVRASLADANTAELLLAQGKLDEAEKILREALRVHLAAGFSYGVAFAEQCLGRLLAARGQHDEARIALEQAAARYDAMVAPASAAEARLYLATSVAESGNTAESRHIVDAVEPVAATSEGPLGVLFLRVRSFTLWQEGEAGAAEKLARRALEMARRANLLYDQAKLLTFLAMVAGCRGASLGAEEEAERRRLETLMGLREDPQPHPLSAAAVG